MHDVAVVGQGPAGGMAALRLAEAGHSVVTFERKKRVGPDGVEGEWVSAWAPPSRRPSEAERSRIIGGTLQEGVLVVMHHQVYEFDGDLFHQQRGAAIGVDLSRALASVRMCTWTVKFKILINVALHHPMRMEVLYVDDQSILGKRPRAGERWDSDAGCVVMDISKVEQDSTLPGDQLTANMHMAVANSISNDIQCTCEVGSQRDNGHLPFLDTEGWLEEVEEEVELAEGGTEVKKGWKIRVEFFSKDCASSYVVMARSAMSMKMKRNTMIQEGVRRLLNC